MCLMGTMCLFVCLMGTMFLCVFYEPFVCLCLVGHMQLPRLQSSGESRFCYPLSLLGHFNQYGDASGVLPGEPLCRVDRNICK